MILDTDNRWVWNIDPKQPFSALTKYSGNRQVTDLPLVQFTSGLPTNDGTNQTFDRVLDPLGSGEYVYRHRIASNRAYGTSWANQTWRAEISNTSMQPVWGVEYWAAWAVLLDEDFAGSSPTVNIHEYHVPYPQPNPVGISPITFFAGQFFTLSIRHNAGVPTNANDYVTGHSWGKAATRGVWHYFVENFKLGADSNANFFRLWHKEGSGALEQVVNYSGRIGYDANTTSRYNYAKFGLYSWTYPWPSGGSPSRTLHSKGLRIISAAGTPEIDQNAMLALIFGGSTPTPDPTILWDGVTFPEVATFSPILDGSYDAWSPIEAPAISGVEFTLAPTQVMVGGTAQFTAHAVGIGDYDDSVTYSVESGDGSIDSAGLYTAGTAGSKTIRATSVEDPTQYDEAVIEVLAVVVSPPAIGVLVDAPVSVTIHGTGQTGASIDLIINEAPFDAVATVTAGAWAYVFTAPPGAYAVIARQTSGDVASDWSDEATFDILADTLTVPGIRVALWPGSALDIAVRRAVGDDGIEGRTITAVSSDPTRVAVTSSAQTDGDGVAVFTLTFAAGGRAVITFADGALSAKLMAITRS